MVGDNAVPYWRSATTPRARLRSRLSNTSSVAQPRMTTAKAQAVPTAPVPMIPIFMILISFYEQFDSGARRFGIRGLSRKVDPRQRQFPDPFAGRRVNGITEGRYERRHSRFAHTSGRRARFDDMDIGLERRFINPRDRIIVKVGLVDHAVGGGYFAAARHAGSKYGGALELRAHQHGIDDQSSIDSHVHLRNSHFSLLVHFDLHYRRHVGREAAMDSDAPAGSFCR